MDIAVFFTGFSLGLSLILAIGAQNAFVLKQGLNAITSLLCVQFVRYLTPL
ncbi:transporter LysE family [Vibrio variabilis]|uniref:Transporter LysE family n=1 Tax=Vibrio variabilis TaxID=990271 RepID=A0ABQ0JB14_9VIBR|nr:transporter LysE family [Vibrio variabilis]